MHLVLQRGRCIIFAPTQHEGINVLSVAVDLHEQPAGYITFEATHLSWFTIVSTNDDPVESGKSTKFGGIQFCKMELEKGENESKSLIKVVKRK